MPNARPCIPTGLGLPEPVVGAEHGVPQLYYANTGYTKFRTNYMLELNQFRVYHEGGIPCYYFFNRLGHYHFMVEDSAWTVYQNQITPNDVIEGAQKCSPSGFTTTPNTAGITGTRS